MQIALASVLAVMVASEAQQRPMSLCPQQIRSMWVAGLMPAVPLGGLQQNADSNECPLAIMLATFVWL